MAMRIPEKSGIFLILALVHTAACDHARNTGAAPTAIEATAMSASSVISSEPATLRPETLPTNSCVGGPAFGTRLVVIVSADGTVIVRGLRFRFTDRFGVVALPHVTSIPGSSPLTDAIVTIPPLGPIPMPGVAPMPTAPLPLPGSGPMDDATFLAATSHRLPFFLRFGCGVAPQGMLTVMIDMGKPGAMPRTSEFRVRVGS